MGGKGGGGVRGVRTCVATERIGQQQVCSCGGNACTTIEASGAYESIKGTRVCREVEGEVKRGKGEVKRSEKWKRICEEI